MVVRCRCLTLGVVQLCMWETSIFDLSGKPRWPHLPRLPDSAAQADLCCCTCGQRPNTANKQHQLHHEAWRTTQSPCCCLSVSSLLPGGGGGGGSPKTECSGGGRYCSICEHVCLALSLVGRYWVSQDHSESRITGYHKCYTWDSWTNSGIKDETFRWPVKYVICCNEYDLHWSQSGVT